MIELLKSVSLLHWFLAYAAFSFHILASIEVAKKKIKQRNAVWIWARFIGDNLYSWLYGFFAVAVVILYAQGDAILNSGTAIAFGYSATDVLSRLTKRAQIQNQ